MADLLDKLAELTPAQQKEAQARLAFLLGTSASATPDAEAGGGAPSGTERLALDCLREVMVGYGFPFPKSDALVRRHPRYAAFLTGAEFLADFVEEAVRPENRVERVAAWRYLFGLVARHRIRLRRDNDKARELSLESFALDLPRVGQVVERNLPGYVTAGLLGAVIGKRRTPRERIRVRRVTRAASA
jgi:hypothetical protein